MPDWSYRTLFQPLLFRLSAARARDATLCAAEMLARLSGPARVIELVGDTRRDGGVTHAGGLAFPAIAGLGAGLDVHHAAGEALAQCGFGFLEFGPVTLEPIEEKHIEVRERDGDIVYEEPLANDGARTLAARLRRRAGVPTGIRLAHEARLAPQAAAAECAELARIFADRVDFFSYDTRAAIMHNRDAATARETIRSAVRAIHSAAPERPLFLVVPPDATPEQCTAWIGDGYGAGIAGVVVAGGIAVARGRLVGRSTFEQSRALVEAIRERWPDGLAIVASGGITEPSDAAAMLAAGATLLQLHSGLVFSGPNLPKRIARTALSVPHATLRSGLHAAQSWAWMFLMGLGICIAGIVAWILGSTRVVLPYDERFVGLTVIQLAHVNSRLLPFMEHDRVTYAGAMLSVGLAYLFLSAFGMRGGISWTRRVAICSSIVGFATFFLFVGVRYLDPVHAAGTAIFFAFFILAVAAPAVTVARPSRDFQNDTAWLSGLWGQLCFIVLGFGFIVGGVTICIVGTTSLFVPADLAFMHTTSAAFASAAPRLIPLVAHDRAYFGGALLVNGIIWLLAAMWGFDRGVRWVWWMFALCGFPGFVSAISVHFAVGYTDVAHLLPVYFALALYIAGLACSRRYLCAR